MKKVSILIGKKYGDILYWRVCANRDIAEHLKMEMELEDVLSHEEGWEYFIQDENIVDKI